MNVRPLPVCAAVGDVSSWHDTDTELRPFSGRYEGGYPDMRQTWQNRREKLLNGLWTQVRLVRFLLL